MVIYTSIHDVVKIIIEKENDKLTLVPVVYPNKKDNIYTTRIKVITETGEEIIYTYFTQGKIKIENGKFV